MSEQDRDVVKEQWLHRVTSLVDEVDAWVRELGWSTRRLDKKLDDLEIGKHTVPALLMQEGVHKVLLEPVGRTSLGGVEGIVDLYHMPQYDDIATLFFQSGQWQIDFGTHRSAGTNNGSDTSSHDFDQLPLSKQSLHKVLAEMMAHAEE